jgi:hypothetical protein
VYATPRTRSAPQLDLDRDLNRDAGAGAQLPIDGRVSFIPRQCDRDRERLAEGARCPNTAALDNKVVCLAIAVGEPLGRFSRGRARPPDCTPVPIGPPVITAESGIARVALHRPPPATVARAPGRRRARLSRRSRTATCVQPRYSTAPDCATSLRSFCGPFGQSLRPLCGPNPHPANTAAPPPAFSGPFARIREYSGFLNLSGRTVQIGFAMRFLGILQTSCKRRTATDRPSARLRPDVCHNEHVCARDVR